MNHYAGCRKELHACLRSPCWPRSFSPRGFRCILGGKFDGTTREEKPTMPLQRITCPSCGSSHFEHDEEGSLICAHCGTKYASPREEIMCPACGTENPPDARRCMNCGLALGKVCPACNYANPPGADHCLNCGSPLDVLETIMTRARSGGRQDELARQRLIASKQSDMVYMQQQRELLDEEERQRLDHLAEQQREARRQQKIIVTVTLIALAVMAVVGVTLAVALLAPGG
jgi:ribosomal protein L40E